jgi:polyisoprenoid-binding protein YceI
MLRKLLLSGLLAVSIAPMMQARADTLKFEPDIVNSKITATVKGPLAYFEDHPEVSGTFQILTGEIEGDPKNPAATGKVKLIIDATTYESGVRTRNDHVLSESLDTSKYQSIEFDSTRLEGVEITPQGNGGDATVVGNLSLHGVTRQISVPVEASLDPDGGFTAWGEFSFDYTDYGIRPPHLLAALSASKEVKVEFSIKARLPGAPPGPTPTPTPTGPSMWDDFVNKVLK